MQVLDSHIGDEQQYAVHNRQQSLRELENAVSQYLPSLYRRAYRYVGDPHDAEDAVQDALLSAYKHLDQFQGAARMTTWLTSIVTNCALGQLRKRPRQPHVSIDEPMAEDQDYPMSDRLADVRPSAEIRCIQSELRGNLMLAVTELPPSMRNAVQLCGLDGLTTREAAKILGLAKGTVKSQVSRARTRLKRIIVNA